jgi:hypothetical protein
LKKINYFVIKLQNVVFFQSKKKKKKKLYQKIELILYYFCLYAGAESPFYWTSLNNMNNSAVWVWEGIGLPLNNITYDYIWGVNNIPINITTNRCAGISILNPPRGIWKTELCLKPSRFICELLEPCRGILYT